jgi:hypothetical protein
VDHGYGGGGLQRCGLGRRGGRGRPDESAVFRLVVDIFRLVRVVVDIYRRVVDI